MSCEDEQLVKDLCILNISVFDKIVDIETGAIGLDRTDGPGDFPRTFKNPLDTPYA